MNTDDVIILARRHLVAMLENNPDGMESSARLCLTDAVNLRDVGDLDNARKRAIRSLGYSIGILHADYVRANDTRTGR
jgi:hypothetical protein